MVLEFDREPPPLPECPGLVSDRQVGTRRELVVIGFDDRQREVVESLSPLDVEVVELNLEEAFIEYTRGPKRSLPVFVGEADHGEGADLQGAA